MSYADFRAQGFALVNDALSAEELAELDRAAAAWTCAGAGSRTLLDRPECRSLAARLREAFDLRGVAFQCTLFDKTPGANWLVALHQDLAVPVRERREHPALRAWSVKEGQDFVQPPVDLLERLVAVRIHLDDCGPDNGPLRVVPGSHVHGRLDPARAAQLRDAVGEVECVVGAGGAVIMKPLLLHASSKARRAGRRRVLHFVFGPPDPGHGLEWPHAA